MWRHWSSFGLLASLSAAAAAARADLPLYSGWTVTSTREEGVDTERGREREYTERERERGPKRSYCHRICMSAAMYWELPSRQGQS